MKTAIVLVILAMATAAGAGEQRSITIRPVWLITNAEGAAYTWDKIGPINEAFEIVYDDGCDGMLEAFYADKFEYGPWSKYIERNGKQTRWAHKGKTLFTKSQIVDLLTRAREFIRPERVYGETMVLNNLLPGHSRLQEAQMRADMHAAEVERIKREDKLAREIDKFLEEIKLKEATP